MSNQTEAQPIPVGRTAEWHWNPALPIPVSPVFAWPPKPIAALRWLTRSWLVLSATIIELALSIGVWA